MIEGVKNIEEQKNPVEKADKIFETSYSANAEAINEVGGSLNQTFFDPMEADIKNLQNDFYNAKTTGDKKEEKKALMKLQQKSANVQNFKETWKMLGESAVDGSLSKGLTSNDKFTLAYATDPSNKPIVNDEGFVWKDVKMPDGTTKDITQSDINNSLVLRDDTTSKQLMDIASEAASSAAKGGEFNKDRQMATVKKLINPKNLRSLMYDDVFNTNSSFIEDIREAFDHPEMEDALTNPKHPMYNEEQTQEFLADYFAKKIEQEHSKGKPKPDETNEYGGMSASELVQKYSK